MNSDALSRTILAREAERGAALVAGDLAALGELLSSRLTFAHANATVDTRESLLSKLEGGSIAYTELSLDDALVIPAGSDAAVLTAQLTADLIVRGQPKTVRNLVLLVWVQEADVWRLLAYQPTPIPDEV